MRNLIVIALVACQPLVACGDTSNGAQDSAASDVTDAETSPDFAAETTPDTALDTVGELAEEVDADEDASEPDITPDVADGADSKVVAEVAADTTPEVEVQVIDPNGDSDHDGISDLIEADDGTDPFNPRSARAWHPEVEGHPRLFTRASDQPAIAARAEAPGGRAKVLWERVVDLAGRAMPVHPADQGYNTDIPPNQAQIAEAAALVGFATGELSATSKALDVLAAPFPDPTPLNLRSLFNAGDHYDLLEADALQGFCAAYDLTAGTAGVDLVVLAAARDNLVKRVDYFRTLCMTTGGCTALLRGEANNHSLKALAALGTCAIAIPDRATAAADFNEALTASDWIAHERQGNLEGGWAESWNYLSYSGETHLGFLAAVHHVAGLIADSSPWQALGEGWITRRNEANGKLVTVLDPAVDLVSRAVYERALFATMPWGVTPPVDDANPSALHGGLVAALFDDARFLWNWDMPRVGMHTGRQLVATFLTLDPETSAVTPDWTDGFFADAGFSVMRRTLAPDSSYFHMQHELEQMRLQGGAHEHADPMSFILAAHGVDLAIDPGYIDFSNHAKVKYGKDHNIVLVDGLGPEFFLDGLYDAPPSSDAYLHAHETSGPFTTLIASTKYGGAEFRRRVVRIVAGADEVFVVADSLVAQGVHTWTFQLNGLAGEEIGGTSFATTPTDIGTLATWQRSEATLFASVAAALGTPTTGSRLEESIYSSGHHRCLTVDAAMGPGAGFLSQLVPSLPAVAPTLTSTRVSGVVVATTTFADGISITTYLNLGASDVAVAERIVAPGLTAVVASAGNAEVVRSWSMQTPPIPDPTLFSP